MQKKPKDRTLEVENRILKQRLAEAEETINAIRNGEVDAILVAGKDGDRVFSLNTAETPYRHLIEEMQEGAVTISEEGTILYCNRSFEELLEKPMEKIIGSNFGQFIKREQRQTFNRIIREKPLEKVSDEIVHYDSKGNKKFLHLSVCPMPEAVLGRYCIVVSDITQIKKYQHDLHSLVEERTIDLQNAIAQLKESNATKDKLFSIIAHDLKGPFTSLLGFSELLTEGASKYDAGQFEMMINNIHLAAKNAYALLENLLLWAMSRNRQIQFNPVELNLNELVAEVIRNQKALAVMKYLTVNFEAEPGIMCYADSNMIKAVVRNILGNSIKFTNHGGIIKISAFKEKNRVRIEISDNGIGMNEDTINNLFVADSNKSINGTAYEKGTGLGMLICDEFVRKHNGRINVKSELGKGSTFSVILPVTKPTSDDKSKSLIRQSTQIEKL